MNSGAGSKFDDGARAFVVGFGRDACPYPPGSGAAAEWLAGWDNEDSLHASERAQYREEAARDMEPYTRRRRDGDVTP